MPDLINIRASSLASLADCGHRWYTEQILGKRLPSTGKATLGSAIHKGTAAWDAAVMNGAPIQIENAMQIASDKVYDPGFEVAWEEDEKPTQVAQIAADLTYMYATQIAPRFTFVAVEVQCEGIAIPELGISLSGSLDRIYQSGNGFGVADVKSGGTAVKADGTVETKGHAFQIGTYELMAEAASEVPISEGGLIIGLQTGKTAKGQRAAVSQPINSARDLLLGDGETPGVLERMALTIKSGNFIGNPRSMMCHKNYCAAYPTCPFRL